MRSRAVTLALCAMVLSAIGFQAGSAFAGTANSSWDRFATFGGSGAGQRCAAHAATVVTPPGVINAYGKVRWSEGDPCDSANAPGGFIGVREWLQRGDGTICAVRTWTYNGQPAHQIDVSTGLGAGTCETWNSLRSRAQGKAWKVHDQEYVVADDVVISPYAS